MMMMMMMRLCWLVSSFAFDCVAALLLHQSVVSLLHYLKQEASPTPSVAVDCTSSGIAIINKEAINV